MRWKLETDQQGARWTALSRFAGPGFESTGATVEERTHRNGSGPDAFGGAKTWPAVTARVELPAGRPELQAELARELRETITRFAWAHDLAVEPSPGSSPGSIPGLRSSRATAACHRREPTPPGRHRIYTVELEVKSRPEGALGDEHTAGARIEWVAREGLSLYSFLAAVLELDPSEVTNATVARAFGCDSPLPGIDLWCEATERKTRQGRGFVQCRWVRL